MRILFVSSGNSKFGINPIVKNQGVSLKKLHDVDFFVIKGRGTWGYFKNIFKLRSFLKNKNYNVVHAHYSRSAFVATLAGCKPLIVSLMGGDVLGSRFSLNLIRFLSNRYWSKTIVKSEDMKIKSSIKDAEVIPNGVDLNRFKPIPQEECLKKLGWAPDKKHILFAANPGRPEKNYKLASEAFLLLKDPSLEIHSLINVPNDQMPVWLNAADVVLLTSLWEGSPNVIKEALACNRPVVSTNVGDVEQLITDVDGCFIVEPTPDDVAKNIKNVLKEKKDIVADHVVQSLSSKAIAEKITSVYTKSLASET